MKENLEATIDAYMDDSYNDGIDKGRETYRRDALLSLNNMMYDHRSTGNHKEANAIAEAMMRLENLK